MGEPPNMSNSSRTAVGSAPARDAPAESAALVRTALRRSVLAPLRFLGFWAAVLLPLAYLPLVHGGLTGGESTVLVTMVAVNVVSLVIGHGYRS